MGAYCKDISVIPAIQVIHIILQCLLHNPELIKGMDKRYGTGASRFMGEALQYYMDNLDGRDDTDTGKCQRKTIEP